MTDLRVVSIACFALGIAAIVYSAITYADGNAAAPVLAPAGVILLVLGFICRRLAER